MRRWVAVAIVVVMAALAAVTWSAIGARREPLPTDDASVAKRDAPAPTTVRPRARTEAAATTVETPAPASSVVHGTVTKFDDTPIANAEVVLFAVNADGLRFADRPVVDFTHPLATTRSAADGGFEISTTANGKVVVRAEKSGFAPKAVLVYSVPAHVVLGAGTVRDFEVVDEDGHPVAGAEIRVLDDDVQRPGAATDEKGRARLVVADPLYLVVVAKGFVTTNKTYHFDETPEIPARIVLHEGRSIEGVVVDSAGKHLDEVLVELAGPDGNSTVRTAADGRFSFDGLRSDVTGDDWRVGATLDDFQTVYVRPAPGDVDVRVVMRRPASVRGVVVYEDGSPAVDTHLVWQADATNVHDENGTFEIEGAAPGTWVLRARAPAPGDSRVTFEGSTAVTAPEGGVVNDVRITVGPPKTMSFVLVRVIDADAKPVYGAAVSAWLGDSFVTASPTDARGEVVLDLADAPAGLRVLVAATVDRDQRRLDARSETVTQSAPPLLPAELRLAPAGHLVLHLVDADGKEIPLAAARVDRGSDERNRDPFGLSVDWEWFATIRVAGFADRWISLAPPQPAVRQETVRLFPACRVVGRVLDAPSDESLGLTVTTADGDTSRIASGGDDGRFSCDAVPPGHARLDAFDHALVRTFDIAPGATVDLGDLRAEKPTPFRVTVLDAEGRGLGAAKVEFHDSPDNEIRDSTVTRPDGTLDVKLPHRGDLHLVVSRRGFATRIVSVPSDAPQPFRVALGPAGRVRIVTSAPCSDPGKDHVEARLPGSEWTWRPREAVADDPFAPIDDARYVLDDLPPGPLELSLVSRLRTRTKTVDVVAGKTVDCVLGE